MHRFVVLITAFLLVDTAQASKSKVVVPNFTTPGLEEAQGRALSEILVSIVSSAVQQLGYEVISWSDIKAMMAVERMKSPLGCEDDVSCLAEIGGALGGDYMVSGTLGKLHLESTRSTMQCFRESTLWLFNFCFHALSSSSM